MRVVRYINNLMRWGYIMSLKDKISLDYRLNTFSKKTQKIVYQFLENFEKPLSKKQYLSAIVRTFELIGDKDIYDLTVDDYNLALNQFENHETVLSCIKSFFRQIHKDGQIKDKDDFTQRFYDEELAKPKKILQKYSKEKEFVPTLSFEQVQKLREFISYDFDSDNFEKLRCSFLAYMLFYTECPLKELQINIDSSNYRNGIIYSPSGSTYIVPEKYEPVFDFHKKRNSYTGFNSLYAYLKILEPILGIKNMKPQVIINAKNENKIQCSNCGKKYLNIINNWINVEGTIICTTCYEELKKNENFKVTDIEEVNLGLPKLRDEVEKSAILFGYDKLKKELLKKTINFTQLHEFFCYIGKLGEAYVYKHEKKELGNTKYADLVDDRPSAYPSMGYDIKSYTKNGEELYIEVKSEPKSKDNDFFLSDAEKRFGGKILKEGKKYIVYRVHNILSKDENEIWIEKIDNIFDDSRYNFKVNNWRVSKGNK